MAEIQRKVIKHGGRNAISRHFHAKNDKETIAAWKLDLNRVLQVFNVCLITFTRMLLIIPSQTELVMNVHVTVSDIHHDVSKIREEISNQIHSVSSGHIQSIENWRILTVV